MCRRWLLGAPVDPSLQRFFHTHTHTHTQIRGEYLELVARAALPHSAVNAADIGTGTGILAALLARRHMTVTATDICDRALACAAENLALLGLASQVSFQVAP